MRLLAIGCRQMPYSYKISEAIGHGITPLSNSEFDRGVRFNLLRLLLLLILILILQLQLLLLNQQLLILKVYLALSVF